LSAKAKDISYKNPLTKPVCQGVFVCDRYKVTVPARNQSKDKTLTKWTFWSYVSAPEKDGDLFIVDGGLEAISILFRDHVTIRSQAAGCAGTAAKGKAT